MEGSLVGTWVVSIGFRFGDLGVEQAGGDVEAVGACIAALCEDTNDILSVFSRDMIDIE